ETGFDITPASEIMAILCLSEGEEDLRQRLGRILVGFTYDEEPVLATDLKAVGAMMVLLRDALMPNLVQSIEGVPTFIHGGPFANIAHGCNSVLATKMALAHSDWTITEAGFGFDLGAEKFFDIKCVSAGLNTAAVILVATIRALKRHGGVLRKNIGKINSAAVAKGLGNLHKHIQNIQAFGEIPVVALNKFATDSEEEIDVVRAACAEVDVPFAVSDHFARGGEGAIELAQTLLDHAETHPSRFRPLYDWSESIPAKVEKVAKTMYGASEVVYSKLAQMQIKRLDKLGYGKLPVCIAKAPTSLTDDPRIAGRPEGFDVTVGSVELSAGAGFVIPLLGDVMRMPGLPLAPQAEAMDLKDGETLGLMGA
ncbi:MAG: formate--tetrahydrofolate ligase, partial [Acidobacteria bacterium]|nr:formate--tetrahydrofolate ligase [Acidobacteriota bacterium]